MQYKPLESAVKYFTGLYESAKDIVQKLENSLIPSSGLELAVAGVPNSVLKRQPETPDKLQGYFFADYGVRDYRRTGRDLVVVTRSDGKQIPLAIPRNGNGIDDQYVQGALRNHGIDVNNKTAGKIAKLLRQKS